MYIWEWKYIKYIMTLYCQDICQTIVILVLQGYLFHTDVVNAFCSKVPTMGVMFVIS